MAHARAAVLLAVAILRACAAETCDHKVNSQTQGSALLQKQKAFVASSPQAVDTRSVKEAEEPSSDAPHAPLKELRSKVAISAQQIASNVTHDSARFDLIQMFGDIIKSFENFEHCLSEEPKYKILSFLEFFTDRFGWDLGGIWNDFQHMYLDDAVASAVEWFNEQAPKAFTKLKTDFLDFSLGTKSIDQLLSVDTLSKALDEHMEVVNDLVTKPGFLPSKCVMSIFVQPNVEKIKETLLPFLQGVMDIVKEFWNGLTSTLMGWIAPAIISVFGGALGDWDKKLAEILEKDAASVCMDQLSYASRELVSAKESGSLTHLVQLASDLNADLTIELTGSVISAAVSAAISELFSWVMDTLVTPGIGIISDAVTWVTQVVLHFINGLCGLIPEAGAAICAAITGSVDYVNKQLQDALDSAANEIIKQGFKLLGAAKKIASFVVDFLKKAYDDVSRSLSGWASGIGNDLDFWMQAGINALAPLLEDFVSMALPATHTAMAQCDKARKGFAEKVSAEAHKLQLLQARGEVVAANVSNGPLLIQQSTSSGIVMMSHSYAAVLDASAQRLLNRDPWVYRIPANRTAMKNLGIAMKNSVKNASPPPAASLANKFVEVHLPAAKVPSPAAEVQPQDMNASANPMGALAIAQDAHQRVNKSTYVHIDSMCYQGDWKYDEWGFWLFDWHYVYTYKRSKECGWALHKGGFFCSHTETMDKDTFLNIVEGQGWSKCYDDANPFETLAKALEVAVKVLQQFGEVNDCVNSLTGVDAKWTEQYVWSFYADRMWDLPRLFADLGTTYIAPTWNAAVDWSTVYTQRHASKGLDAIDKFIYGGKFDADLSWVKEQLDYAWDLVNNKETGLFYQPGLGPMKCWAEKVFPKVYEQSRDVVAEVILNVVKPVVDFIPNVMEDLQNFIAQTAAASADSDDWFGEATGMFRAAVQKSCVDDIAYGGAGTGLSINLFTLAINMVEPLVTKLSNWLMDVVIGPVVKGVQKLLEDLSDLIMHTLDGLAGLAPFAGGFIGALVSSAQSSVKSLLQQFSYDGIIAAIKGLFTQVKDWIVDAMKSAGELVDDLMKSVMEGPFKPIADIVLKFIQWMLAAVAGSDLETCKTAKQALA